MLNIQGGGSSFSWAYSSSLLGTIFFSITNNSFPLIFFFTYLNSTFISGYVELGASSPRTNKCFFSSNLSRTFFGKMGTTKYNEVFASL